jgi:hypothetical protein
MGKKEMFEDLGLGGSGEPVADAISNAEAPVRLRVKAPSVLLHWGNYVHKMTYDATNDVIIAHCGKHGFSKCRRTCAAYEGVRAKKGSGRPVGYLGAWLEACDHDGVVDPSSHKLKYKLKAHAPDYDTRFAARLRVIDAEGADVILDRERDAEVGHCEEPNDYEP